MMYSQGLRLFYNRGLHLLMTQPAVTRLAFTSQRAFSVVNQEMRDFSTKKKKGGKKSAASQSDAEASGNEGAEDDKFAAARHSHTEHADVDRSLFTPFTLGDVKKIQSTPDH